VFPGLHQGQHEFIVVAQDDKGARAAFEEAPEAEEPLEECGETGYVRGGEVEMLELHEFFRPGLRHGRRRNSRRCRGTEFNFP
jgi:hypothetical protein